MAEINIKNYGDELNWFIKHGEFREEMNPADFKKTVREEIQRISDELPFDGTSSDDIDDYCHLILERVAESLGFTSGSSDRAHRYYYAHRSDSTYPILDFEPMDSMCLLVCICDNVFDIENVIDDLCEPLVNYADTIIENDLNTK